MDQEDIRKETFRVSLAASLTGLKRRRPYRWITDRLSL
jgi:hypothetical protein